MQTFKTYEQLMKHYWGIIVPMAQAAGIKPWECVRIYGTDRQNHPSFDFSTEDYTFALAILEGKPVFVGDKLWSLLTDSWYVVSALSVACLMKNYTWTPQAKKRTFMLNMTEDEVIDTLDLLSCFRSKLPAIGSVIDKLTEARDKE